MKNFSLNIKKSSLRGNLLAALLMVTASLLLGTSAYARAFTKGETIYVNTKYHSWFNNESYFPTLNSSSSASTEFAQASAYSSSHFYTLEVTRNTDDLDYIYIERCNGSGSWKNKYKFAVGEGNEIVILSNQNDNEWLGNWRTYDPDPTPYNVWLYTASTTPKVYAYLSKGESLLLGAWSGTEAPLDASNNYSWHKVSLPADIYDLKYKLIISDNGSAQYPASGGTEFNSKDAIMWYYNDKGTGKGGIKDISKYQFYFDDASTLDPTAFKAVNPQYGFYATINLSSGAHKVGWKYDGTAKTGDDLKFSNTRGNVTNLEKVDENTYIQFTLDAASEVTIYVDPGSEQVFIDAESIITGDAPTVLLGANPEVTDARATLHGYLKFTGCNNVTAFGFNWSTTQADIDKDVPTGAAVAATSPAAPITVGNHGTEFTLANYDFNVSGTQTIYYKAYATNAVGTSYSAMGQFETSGCVKPVVTEITLSEDPVCDNAGTITATADNITGATYAWEVDGTIFTAASGDTYQASITVGTAGTTGSISVTPTLNGCVGNKFTKSNIEVKAASMTAKNLKYQLEGEEEVKTEEAATYDFCEGPSITLTITSEEKTETSYAWTIPASWTVTAGSISSQTLTATIGSTGGLVSVTIENACGSSATRTFIANVTAIPATPGTITGDASVCKQSDHTYTIEAVADAKGYEWILPAGWSGTCGATGNILNARAGADATSGTIKVKATNSCGSSAYNTGKEVTVSGYSIVITGTGAKSAAATYPWELFNLTATTEASTISWNAVYSTTIAEDLTVFKSDGKTATLKSGAPVSDTDHYTVTASTTDGGCNTTSDGYDVYINAAPVEECN